MPKVKVIKKKTTKKPKPPMEQKRQYEIISTGTRGIIQNITYRVPKKKNITKTLKNIQEYVNIKSRQMSKVNGLKDSRVSIALKFDNNKYISTSYINAGKDNNISNVYAEYDDADLGKYGKITEFSIQFIPNI
jgi:hypothetical protein